MIVKSVNKMKDHKPLVEAQIRGFLYRYTYKQYLYAVKEITMLLKKTLENRRAESGFRSAVPKIVRSSVLARSYGIGGKAVLQVVDARTGKPHEIWHYISGGTRNIIAKKDITFKPINEARTTPRSLEVGAYSGESGWVTIRKGRLRRGVKGRFFYSTTIQEYRDNHKGDVVESVISITSSED